MKKYLYKILTSLYLKFILVIIDDIKKYNYSLIRYNERYPNIHVKYSCRFDSLTV